MATHTLTILVILLFAKSSIQDNANNKVDDDASGLYDNVISDILKEQTAENLGAKLQNFLQEEGGNILGEALSKLATENAGSIMEGLGNVLSSQGKAQESKEKQQDDSAANLLQGLGALAGAFQAAGGGNGDSAGALLQGLGSLMGDQAGGGNGGAGALLQGLGSLMGDQAGGGNGGAGALLQGLGSLMGDQGRAGNGGDGGAGALLQGLGALLGGQGQNGRGGLNPELIGSLLNAFTQSQNKPDKSKKAKKSITPKKVEKVEDSDDSELPDLLPLLSQLIGGGTKGKDVSIGNILLMALKTINSFVGPEAKKREAGHSDHAWSLPPYLEKIHVMFDHLIHSDMGKYLIELLGTEKSFKVFTDESGKFNYKKFGELMENHSFRRHWIRQVTERISGILQYLADPKVYKTYIASGHFFINSYLKSLGFPKSAMLDPARPVESISAFLNHVGKKYFDLKIRSKEYVKPAIKYLQDLLKLAENAGSENSKQLSNSLADTINMEVIEPLARVNRAYRFAKSHPTCDRYVFCVVNDDSGAKDDENIPGLKGVLHKGASLAASWFLSSHTGTNFFVLYTDITSGGNCKVLYKDECNDFHLEELKVTTEYVHNEL